MLRGVTAFFRTHGLIIYGAAVITALLWPLAFPGFLGLRDMVVLPQPALSAEAVGFGSLPARNAPQDGVLALIGTVFPADIFVRFLLVGTALISAYCATLWGKTAWQKAAALTLCLWNPFVVERLLQGQWSLVMAAWLLPAIAYYGSSPKRQWLLLWGVSLTPTGAVMGALVAISTSTKKWATVAISLVCSLPWLIPSLLQPPSFTNSATAAFVARAEGFVGTVGALLGTGGIWNAQAVPVSRESLFALFGVLLSALLIPFMPKRLAILAGCGLGGALILTFGPTEWLLTHIPGLALFRDAQKLIMLAIPAMVAAAGRIAPKALTVTVLVFALLQIPTVPTAVAALKPHSTAGAQMWAQQPGTTLLIAESPQIVIAGTPMLNPWIKATPTLYNSSLIVDGEVIDLPTDDYLSAVTLYQQHDWTGLAHRDICTVITQGAQEKNPACAGIAHHSQSQGFWVGLALTAAWLATGLMLLVACLRTLRGLRNKG